MRGELLKLSRATVTSRATLPLPNGVLSMRWSRSADEILLTTLDGQSSELLRVNLTTGTRQVLYQSKSRLRYPLETEPNVYVFLEAREPGGRYSYWQRLTSTGKTMLNNATYSMAGPLEQVGGSLHLLEPTKQFRQFDGALPAGMGELITPTTWYVYCAEGTALTCVRTHAFLTRSGGVYGKMEVVHGPKMTCSVGDRWIAEREIHISADGSTVVFHGGKEHGAERLVYLLNTSGDCKPVVAYP